MKSLAQKVEQLRGLVGTKDVNTWESEFIQSVAESVDRFRCTTNLSDKQAEVVDRIWRKHFA